MLLQEIREDTRKRHQSLEAAIIPRMKSLDSISEYATLLSAFFGYTTVVENLIARHINTEVFTDLRMRRSANLLLLDIKAAIGWINFTEAPKKLPYIDDEYSAAGALYVLEGSTLGGDAIVGMLRKRLGAGVEDCTAYFRGYGDANGKMWSQFCSNLSIYDAAPEAARSVLVNAASQTFSCFEEYLNAHLPQAALKTAF